ncbi:hypothetical protein BOX15_Mlig010431g1 [Macrostomum lignano]|uniref:Uncharacterized protein n=1 Tax=Macrostomum lignano TaxID=282301 RepID=A0A267GZR2_9PLAT|nr:hypothetical protein BOX15_Mlig010431g1 [Macrostomum lignano]
MTIRVFINFIKAGLQSLEFDPSEISNVKLHLDSTNCISWMDANTDWTIIGTSDSRSIQLLTAERECNINAGNYDNVKMELCIGHTPSKVLEFSTKKLKISNSTGKNNINVDVKFTKKRPQYKWFCRPIYPVTLNFQCENSVSISNSELQIDMTSCKTSVLKPLDSLAICAAKFHRVDTNRDVTKAKLPDLKWTGKSKSNFSLVVRAATDNDEAVEITEQPNGFEEAPATTVKKKETMTHSEHSLVLEFRIDCDNLTEHKSVKLLHEDKDIELERKTDSQHLIGTTTLTVFRQEMKLVPVIDGEEKSFKDCKFIMQISETKDSSTKENMFSLEKLGEDKENLLKRVIVRVKIEPFEAVLLVPKCFILCFELEAEKADDAWIFTSIGDHSHKCTQNEVGQNGRFVLSHVCQVTYEYLEFEYGYVSFKVWKCLQGDVEFRGAVENFLVEISGVPATADGVVIRGQLEDLPNTLEIQPMDKCSLINLVMYYFDCEDKVDESHHVTGNCMELGNRRCLQTNQLNWSEECGKGVKYFKSTTLLVTKSVGKDGSKLVYHVTRGPTNKDANSLTEEAYFLLKSSEKMKTEGEEIAQWWLSDWIDLGQKESDQKESDQKESDQKESDQKESDQKESDQKESDQKESDQKKSDQKESDQDHGMTWGGVPTEMRIVTLNIVAFCEIKFKEFLQNISIRTNFDKEYIQLIRSPQEKKPTREDPIGLEKWSHKIKFNAYINGTIFLNIDKKQLCFTELLLAYKVNKKVTLVTYYKTIKLQGDPLRGEINYEVSVSSDYRSIDVRPGVYVTLQLASFTVPSPAKAKRKDQDITISGKFLLRSGTKENGSLTPAESNAARNVGEEKSSCGCTCRNADGTKAKECTGNELIQASKSLLMFKHGRQLMLSGKRPLYVKFEQTNQKSAASDRNDSDGLLTGFTRIDLACGPASGSLEYYCQLPSNRSELIVTNLLKVRLKLVTKWKENDMIDSLEIRVVGCFPENKFRQETAGIYKWIKNVTLKMFQMQEELFLTGERQLCIMRVLKSKGEIKEQSKHKIQLLAHQPGEYLQFQIELFSGNDAHRVFPNMPMNQLPKDSILRYFQTTLRSVLPDFPAKFTEVRDVYAKRLVPLIKQNGDYDEADGASRPHEFHDIWGEDPESDLDEVDELAIVEPRSAVRYVQQKRHRNLENSRNFTQEIHNRLNKKYHLRERIVWSHLSAAAASCPACKGIYNEYEYRGSSLRKAESAESEKLLHDEYIGVLTQVAKNIVSKECTCRYDHQLVMSNSAAVVRGRIEAFLVDNTSNMLSDQFFDEWRRHTEASGSWFVLLLAVWQRSKMRSRMGFEDTIRETCLSVPAFFKWKTED